MRFGKAFAAIALGATLLGTGSVASAHPPADDFLNPQDPGPRLTLMPFVGPGFRANYDHRFTIEKDMSELRTQLIGTVAVPFAEVSANVDVRFFLMLFGASVGYHDEWHVLQFHPDPTTGRDLAGQTNPPAVKGIIDLDRDARALKDQNADVGIAHWNFYEGRWGFVWPAYNFMGVSNLAVRWDGRPDVTYDWENGTVYNGGVNVRWEGYALLRERNTGFIGPAFRAMYVPRNRVQGDQVLPSGAIVPDGSACQDSERLKCSHVHEFEFQYGILAGLRPNWTASPDTFLIRAYTTYGFHNQLFGTQVFRAPIQILVAYMVDIDL